MKIEDAKVGMEVRTHPTGPTLTIKEITARLARVVWKDDFGVEWDQGVCPVVILDKIE